jgi:hypothetical protein
VVAGKSGTAQSTDRGQKEHIAWFCCFAPYDKPKYCVVVMVQGGEHGGSVAAPVAAHILSQALAVDAGKLTVDLKPLAPAHNPHPFEMITALPPYGTESGIVAVASDDPSDNPTDATAQQVQMGGAPNASPDIKADADAEGRRPIRRAVPVLSTPQPKPILLRARPVAQPEQPRRNFFERIFNSNRKPN